MDTNPAQQVHLPRWERTLGIDLVGGLVFLPYLPHAAMLAVVANCAVMLDTFPWGAGVTSMESLSAGVPVVTLPARLSVLPLALGQVSNDCCSSGVAAVSFGCLGQSWPDCIMVRSIVQSDVVPYRIRSKRESGAAFEEIYNESQKPTCTRGRTLGTPSSSMPRKFNK